MTSVRSSYTSFRSSYTSCKPQNARDTRDWRGETGRGKFNVQTRMLHCAASISHSAPQHTHIKHSMLKGWGRTHKRMSHVNSIWNAYVELSMRDVLIKEVEYWILKYGCWIVNDNETRMLCCDTTQLEYTNECRMWISVNSIWNIDVE